LISLAHRIATEPACAQAQDIPRLQAVAIALVNAHRVPAALQDPLMSGVGALSAQTPVCLPPVTTTSVPAQALPPARPKHHGHHGHGHGKGE
jgi:hypothetical protein